MKYVLFKPKRYGGAFAETYWTGNFTEVGNAEQSTKTADAIQFNTAREAYEEAGRFKRLNWWKVGERRIETIH